MAKHPPYRVAARRYAKRYGLNPDVFERQIDAESGFDKNAGSPAGAQGIAQFMPGTAKGLGINPRDPYNSLAGAAKLMAGYVKKYGSYEKALRAYNAGEGAIEKSRGYGETNEYVRKILNGKDPGKLGAPGKKGQPGTKDTKLQLQDKVTTDKRQAVLDSVLAGPSGRKGGSLAKDIISRLVSGEYDSTTPGKTVTVKGAPKVAGSEPGSSKATVKDGKGWAGTQAVAETAGAGFITSAKRTPAQNAAAGGASGSDHLTTNKRAYAVDMKAGDHTARSVAKRLGLKNWKPGSYERHIIRVGKHRYSVQLLWKVEGHYDHVHLGVQRV